jgi:tagatose 6-phosphate kinase
MILCIGTTPAAQRVMVVRSLELDAVNRAKTTLDGFAGKSINVAKVLAALGAQPTAAGFAGGDRGRELLKVMASLGIGLNFVEVAASTRQCISVLDEAAHTVTELVEESASVSSEDYASLLAIIRKRLPGCSAVVMSGSLTPGGPTDFYRVVTSWAGELGVLSVVDAQGPVLLEALAAKPGLVKPNRSELAATVQRPLKTEKQVISAIQEILEGGAGRVVVTAGKSSALACDGQTAWRIHSPEILPLNPIGSGDAFTAGLVWRLTQKDSLGEACRWAAAAGAANALSLMPGDLDKREVERLVKEVKVEQI